jgi:hypothetical protein
MEAAAARQETLSGNRIQLPFIIVNTSQAAMIDCQMAEDRSVLVWLSPSALPQSYVL